jgi:hypothetical protein
MMDLTSVYKKINNDEYKTKLPFKIRIYPYLNSHYVPRRESEAAYKQYKEDLARLEQEFKNDAIEAVGLKDHPKAEKAYALAWDHGHSAGFSDVLGYLSEFADLIL